GADGVFGRTDVKKVTAGGNPLGIDLTDPAAQDDVITLNQLHLPVDKPAIIYLSSKDVIHSFFLPQMRVKQDAIPGQVIPVYFTPNKVTPPDAQFPACASAKPKNCWEIACAQLCGLTHYRMQGYYTVHTQADFDKWLADNAPKPQPAAVAPLPAPPAATGEPVTPSGQTVPGADPVGGDGHGTEGHG
ncbi:MAG TPA: cytochrome c oxidase subunit II, partial [Thermoanaerobaculia bacterium]|nr:cytochrome c oxidase subunit II [Thermoanaerobaculia bacterium]